MDLGSIFIILAVLLLVVLFVSRPFFEKQASTQPASSGVVDETSQRFSSLLAERDRVLNAIQELDFDNALGKIPAGDFEVQRRELMTKGASVLQQLDAIQASVSAETVEDRIEAVIAARRSLGSPAPANGDAIEELIANRRKAREESGGGFCPSCGKPVQKSDRFCPKCGEALQ